MSFALPIFTLFITFSSANTKTSQIAIINNDNVNVVVDSKEELNVASVAQIQNIIQTEVGTPVENIRIIQK